MEKMVTPQSDAAVPPELDERRARPRIPCQFVVRFQRYTERTSRVSSLHNLSRRGARFVSEELFEPGEFLKVWLRLPAAPEPVQIPSRVAWCRPAFSERLGTHELGVAFLLLEPQAERVLERTLYHLATH